MNKTDSILDKYKLLVEKYQLIENELSEIDIHDKRVILRKIFPILSAYKMNASAIKNGEKAFRLFGKLRDVQVQILKLEDVQMSTELSGYLSMLKEKESELKAKAHKFTKKKKVVFPKLNKKRKIEKSKILNKANKLLDKLELKIYSGFIDDPANIHKLRIKFKKFRYQVEMLSYIEKVDPRSLHKLKSYQDQLGEINDYEVLINGIEKYYSNKEWDEDPVIALFEQEQNTLYETFIFNIETFVRDCRVTLQLKQIWA
jgi:CHAD domain-containing protein